MAHDQETEREEPETRDIELENIIGNLMIAEYQVDKLRTRVTEKIAGRYPNEPEKRVSTHMFKHNGRWVKISVKVQEIEIDKARGIQGNGIE